MDFTFLIGAFAGIISILNPVGNVPIFLEHVQTDSPKVQFAVALLMGLSIFLLLILFFFTGRAALNLFSITIPAFRIAGGILILLVGIRMMQGRSKFSNDGLQTSSPDKNPFEAASLRLGSIIVPVAMPIFVGPGTITTVILFSDKTQGILNFGGMVLVMALCACIVTTCLVFSRFVYRILGNNGMQIVVRFMGMILCAMAVQFMIDGAAQLLPGVLNPAFVHSAVK